MNTVLRAIGAYFMLLLAARALGRRTLSQMAPLDLIVLFLFGGITITSVMADDRSMAGAFSAIAAIGFMHILIGELKIRFPSVGRLIDGTPVILFERGHWHKSRMRRMRIEEQDIMAAARQKGLQRQDQIEFAVAERDGKVSIIPKP